MNCVLVGRAVVRSVCAALGAAIRRSVTSAGCSRSSAAAQDRPPCVDSWPHRSSGPSRNSRLKPLNRPPPGSNHDFPSIRRNRPRGASPATLFGLAQIAGSCEPYLEFAAPTMTAVFVWAWPRILMRIEHRSDLADLERVTNQISSLKLDDDARKTMEEELKKSSETLARRLLDSLQISTSLEARLRSWVPFLWL